MTSASSITTEVSASTIPDYFNYTIRPYATTNTTTTTTPAAELPATQFEPPTLDELLDSNTPQDSHYNLLNFITYLTNIHCQENLEFILDINTYLLLHPPTLVHWQRLYYKYIAVDSPYEINLPCCYRSLLCPLTKPDFTLLIKCKRSIYDDILINLYHEFIKYVKGCEFQDCKLNYSPQLSPSQSIYHSSSSCCTNGSKMINNKKKNKKHVAKDGYDYYTIPSSDSSNSTTEDLPTCPRTANTSTTTSSTSHCKSNSSNNSRGIALGSSIIDSIKSVDYKIKIKKFKFRRSSSDHI